MAVSNEYVVEEFKGWLRIMLTDLKIDDEIFSPYIIGILNTEDSAEEKSTALKEILFDLVPKDKDCDAICDKITSHFHNKLESFLKLQVEEKLSKIGIDEKLSQLIEESKQKYKAVTQNNAKEQDLKQQILSQYSQVSGDEETDDRDDSFDTAEKNFNVQNVIHAEKENRDKNKLEAQKRKEKDKEDRMKQKLKVEEKKQKEKQRTQKGEKRR